MDFASLTAGRMALNFGSGRILGDNDWVKLETVTHGTVSIWHQ